MLTDISKHILEALKLAPRYLVALALVLTFLLFSPNELTQQLGVSDLAKDYRQGMGIGLLLCISLLLVEGFRLAHRAFMERRTSRKFKRKLHERLRRLTEDEKQILRYYLAQQTRANTLRIDDGVVQGLVRSGVIFQSAAIGNVIEGFAHNINEIAWEVLNKDPGMLVGTTELYRTDKRNGRR